LFAIYKRILLSLIFPAGHATLIRATVTAACPQQNGEDPAMKRLATAIGALAMSTSLAAAESYTLQNVFGLNVPSIGPSPIHWAELVELMTGGDIKISVHGPGDFVPGAEVFGAVSSGALDMGFDWPGYWAAQIPVTNNVGSMPFGPDPDTVMAWMYRGGGLEIVQRAYEPFNVHFLPCQVVVQEAGGWFNKEITSPDDFKGLNMRIAGLGALALARLGANTQLVPPGEVYLALETGRIDAAEFSAPSLDVGMGFQKVAKYYYFPGWHQGGVWDSVIINGDVWKGLGETNQRILEEACRANVTYQLVDQLDAQAKAIATIREAGVEIKRFPDEVLHALRKAADEVLKEQAAADPLFAEALDSLTAYTKRVGEWSKLQALPTAE
jgi:TRAP-type mannitol/chloroaromatic compound transport system substrate-binding protein